MTSRDPARLLGPAFGALWTTRGDGEPLAPQLGPAGRALWATKGRQIDPEPDPVLTDYALRRARWALATGQDWRTFDALTADDLDAWDQALRESR